MRKELVKIGMEVKIISLETTHERYGVNDKMKSMIGKIYKVINIDSEDNFTVKLNNEIWNWAPEDLTPVIHIGKIKEVKGGKFDIENLVI